MYTPSSDIILRESCAACRSLAKLRSSKAFRSELNPSLSFSSSGKLAALINSPTLINVFGRFNALLSSSKGNKGSSFRKLGLVFFRAGFLICSSFKSLLVENCATSVSVF